MTVIRLREQHIDGQSMTACVSFDYGIEYSFQLSDPFASQPGQEDNLEWYFEEYLEFPMLETVRARNAAASIQAYGEALFRQIFAGPAALAAYKQARLQGLPTLQIEVAGSPAFHRLHWEALYDPELKLPLVLHTSLIRKNIVPQTFPAEMSPSTTLRVLVVVARPRQGRDVGYRTISRPLVEQLEQTKLPIDITLLRPGTYQALSKHLEQVARTHGMGYYHLIHFDVHGALLDQQQLQEGVQTNRLLYGKRYGREDLADYAGEKAFVFLEGEQEGQADPVEASELAQLLLQYQVPMVLLNACQSGKASEVTESTLGSRLIEAGVQTVLAMGYSVTVSAAELLMKTLYQELFDQKPLPEALCLARQELANQKQRRAFFNLHIELEDWLLPILYQNQPVRFVHRPFTSEEYAAFYQGKARAYSATQQPSYGFVGRDLDILQIEKRLLTRRNILLIRGMGGAGKTTLLHHLASWWQRTGLVQEVFYFGYDERAWNRQQILRALAQRLLDKHTFLDFQSLSLDAQQAQITQLLRSTQHLLILDNLEAINGTALGLKHPLSRKEQENMRLLLVDLFGGKTLVLLGSRSGESWLAKGTFEENLYDLAGLDQEAASQLAERILERHNASKYRADANLRKLLKLLDGFPLALEVVLANLAHQTPAQVLEALEQGDVSFQVGTSEERTKNILRCVDYSYRNLSPDAQQLLLCLAPFTSVIWRDMLGRYAEHLKQQPALATFPFEQWENMIQETEKWGLLSADQDVPPFLHIQPVFPYFLRQNLATSASLEMQTAIEEAFYAHYTALSSGILGLIQSREPQERQAGFALISYEYENLLWALRFAVQRNRGLFDIFFALGEYLDTQKDYQHGQELDQQLLQALGKLSWEDLDEGRKEEWVRLLGTIANRQLDLKQYQAAGDSYKSLLEMLQTVPSDERKRGILQARTYHQLGMVAQEQRQWEQAEAGFLEALEIFVEYKEAHNTGIVLRSLARLWQEKKETSLVERVAALVGMTTEETEKLFQEATKSSQEQHHGEEKTSS